ncbi:SDR family NAD(P)-dependent oxidoreductase [Actinoplanes sp. NPDC024001]|uniref:SDR family NAD(P)-dependent oxidoreductase n=1 Tax=Actinoplanes sp. NPDC024001 TaxID=3154598 RepID=UPI0033D256F4
MKGFRGKVAVVTGAGSGIGRALALALAARGARLAVSDIDPAGLAEFDPGVHTATLDVSDRDAVVDYAATVAAHYGVVHQVYNNAGISGGGQSVLDTSWEVYEKTLAVNLFGVIHGTKAFLPHLIASGDGHVVNISSLNGFLAQPTLSAYAASKFGVRGFTEALRTEMLVGGHPVQVSVVHPGGVKTNIASATGSDLTPAQAARVRVYNEKLLTMPAAEAARIILDGVEAGRPRILVGRDAKAVDRLVRLLPRRYPALVARYERRLFGDA